MCVYYTTVFIITIHAAPWLVVKSRGLSTFCLHSDDVGFAPISPSVHCSVGLCLVCIIQMCSELFSVFGVLYALCSVKCEVCSVQCAVWSVKCEVCSVQCAACSVQFTVYSVQCAVCTCQCFAGQQFLTLGNNLFRSSR